MQILGVDYVHARGVGVMVLVVRFPQQSRTWLWDPPPQLTTILAFSIRLADLYRLPLPECSDEVLGGTGPRPSPTLFFLRWEDIVIWGNVIDLPEVHENGPHK